MGKNVELHIHLEGCVWNKHIRRRLSSSSFLFPPPNFVYQDNFEKFLAHLRFRYNFLNSLDAYCEVFNDYLDYCRYNNIIYSELQINKALLDTWNINLRQLLAKFQSIKSKFETITIKYIIDIPWQFSTQIIEEVLTYENLYEDLDVVAIGFGGDERLAKLDNLMLFKKQFTQTKFKLLCHIGESDNPKAKEIIKLLKPNRIAHGIKIINWIIEEFRPSNGIDFCLTSNLQMGVVDNIKVHPIKDIIESQIPFTLSTDDPAIFNTTLNDEINLAVGNFKNITIGSLQENAIKCAFALE